MSTLGKAVIEFSADTAKFTGDVGRAAALFEKSMARMENGIFALRNAFVAVAGAGGLGAIVKGAIDAGDQLNKLSQKVGISVESLSELKLGAELADVNLEALTIGLKEFNKALTEAQDPNSKAGGIFAALGVDPRQNPEQALRQFAEAMSRMQDGATKTAVAVEIMGKAGINMIPWLNQGAAGMDKAAQSARNLGLVISADFARQSEQFNDNVKLLTKNTEALGIKIGGDLVGGLATLTSRMVEATEKGQGFLGWMREMVFVATALGEKLNLIPRGVGQLIFDTLEPGGGFARGGAKSGLIKGPDGLPINQGGTPAPNPDAVACAASGGKWVNGQCVRAGGTAKKADDNLVGRQWAEAEEEWAKIMSEASQLTDDFYRKQREGEQELDETRMKAWFEFIDRENEREEIQMRLAAGFDAEGRALKQLKDDSQQWGFIFNSAIEDAILNFKSLGDVVRAVGNDIARMILRKTVTEPLGNAVGSIVGKAVGSIFGGGGSAPVYGDNPEYAEGTDFVPRTGLALLHQGEAVIPASENMAGGRGAVNITLNVGSLDPRTAASVILQNMPVIAGALAKAAYLRGKPSPV